jgi:TetR/AcrR family transcriptional regulator, tetracycline repressor protein
MARTRRRGLGVAAAHADPDPTLPQPLDRDQVVRAALSLLDENGLDGLSMRRLAERLAIRAASLYWYVRDKDELLSLLADAISAEVRAPTEDTSWRVLLGTLLGEYRRVLRAHRDAARILAGTVPAGPHRLHLTDTALGALRAAGFADLDAARAGRLVVDYVTAFVVEEDNETALLDAFATKHEKNSAGEPPAPFTTIAAETYPSIAALAGCLMDSDSDGRFAFGLKILLDGLELHLAQPAARPTDHGENSV